MNEEMAREARIAIANVIQVYWKIQHEMPNPSPEGRALLHRIRTLEKVERNIGGLQAEKGWNASP